MRESIKSRYGNEILEKVFQYFMRTVLRLQDSGIEKLPLQNDFEEPLKSYIDIAVDLIIDGQPPEITSLILDAEYGTILSGGPVSVETAMSLRLIRADAFTEQFTAERFADVLFSLMLSALLRQDYDSTAILEIVSRALY